MLIDIAHRLYCFLLLLLLSSFFFQKKKFFFVLKTLDKNKFYTKNLNMKTVGSKLLDAQT